MQNQWPGQPDRHAVQAPTSVCHGPIIPCGPHFAPCRPATPQCSACALAWDPVCATINGQQVELGNACLATCQAITAYTSGRCTSSTGRTARVPRFSLPSSSMSLSQLTVKASTMNAMSDAGYVYVGTFKSLDGPPAELKVGNGLLMVNKTTNKAR